MRTQIIFAAALIFQGVPIAHADIIRLSCKFPDAPSITFVIDSKKETLNGTPNSSVNIGESTISWNQTVTIDTEQVRAYFVIDRTTGDALLNSPSIDRPKLGSCAKAKENKF